MLCTRYHTGNGFFINSSLLMFSLLVNAWLCLLLALSSVTPVGSTVLADALALLGGLQLLQLGSLSLLVYVATVWLEDGFMVTLKNVLKQLVSGELSTKPDGVLAAPLPPLFVQFSIRLMGQQDFPPPSRSCPVLCC